MKNISYYIPYAFLILFLALLVRLWHVWALPGEWYGDISNVHEYVEQIHRGEWPWYFFQSPGPVYHYAIYPITRLFSNQGYETYKIASSVVSLIVILATMLMARGIGDRQLALTTGLVMSMSFWFLIWSRLGNSQIIIPLLSSLLVYFFIQYTRFTKYSNLFFACLIASLGWYTYPQTFLFPLLLFFSCIPVVHNRRHMFSLVLFLILGAIPFLFMVAHQPDIFGGGYIGEKVVPVFSKTPAEVLTVLGTNYTKTLLMLHGTGDGLFRSNVAGHPHLDRISGILFFLGVIWMLRVRLWMGVSLLSLMAVLILPSVSPAIGAGEIPSSSRTLAIVPFVYLFVSYGLLWIFRLLTRFVKGHPGKIFAAGSVSVLFLTLVGYNMDLYFIRYSDGLPNNSTAPGKEIARYIDASVSPDVNVYFASCCWGEWGEPEPKAIAYVLRKKRSRVFSDHVLESCDEITTRPALLVSRPDDHEALIPFQACFPNHRIVDIESQTGKPLVRFLFLDT